MKLTLSSIPIMLCIILGHEGIGSIPQRDNSIFLPRC